MVRRWTCEQYHEQLYTMDNSNNEKNSRHDVLQV